jgi:hypothetical protein
MNKVKIKENNKIIILFYLIYKYLFIYITNSFTLDELLYHKEQSFLLYRP